MHCDFTETLIEGDFHQFSSPPPTHFSAFFTSIFLFITEKSSQGKRLAPLIDMFTCYIALSTMVVNYN